MKVEKMKNNEKKVKKVVLGYNPIIQNSIR